MHPQHAIRSWSLLVALAGSWVALPAPRAFAQAGEALIVPSSVANAGVGTPSSRHAAQQLARAMGGGTQRVLAAERARASFEQRGSTAPLMVSHGDLDALARDAQMALYHVASGLPGRARADVERALERADKVLESLNRESLAAQQLLDACLYLVRAHLQDKNREQARAQALECRRLVPDIEPDGTMHPPDVIGVLAEAEAALRQREPGSLRVESVPAGCAVYLNGRHLGAAPLELPQLSPGEYRIQAECEEGRAGRVHRVTVGSARVVKRIDTRFDAAVQTMLDLGLRYDTPALQHERAYGDALEAARVIGVAEVLLVMPWFDPLGRLTDVVQVDRIRAQDGALLAAARLRVDTAGAIESAALGLSVRALREGQQLDFTGATPINISNVGAIARVPAPVVPGKVASRMPAPKSVVAPAPREAAARNAFGEDEVAPAASAHDDEVDRADDGRPPTLAGVVLGAAGGVATLAGLGLYGYQLSLELEYSDEKTAFDEGAYEATLEDLDGVAPWPLIVNGTGAALLTASLPWLLPDAEGVPALAIASGAVGGVLAVAGAVLLITGSQCDTFDVNGRCTDITATSRLGGILLENAVPLGAVPIVYLLRGNAAPGESATVSIEPNISEQGVQLNLRAVL